MTMKRPVRISIDGNLSSGKSSIITKLGTVFETVPEPVSLWQNFNGFNVLRLSYENPERWLFQFQSTVLLTLTEAHARIDNAQPAAAVVVCERSVDSAYRVFMRLAVDKNIITPCERTILSAWRDFLSSNFPIVPDYTIYLKTDPAVCLERLKWRGRSEEGNVSIDYLNEIDALYDSWLTPSSSNVIVVDGNQCFDKVYKRCFEIVTELSAVRPDRKTPQYK